MFEKLFSHSGLSLDRLRAFVEVGAAGSIVQAARNDPVKQSQYSRQIKELEDFFQARLVERFGKGIRFTPHGRELARISRFFLLGLSNFQRGRLSAEQHFRIAASSSFATTFLVPLLASPSPQSGLHYAIEKASDDEIERRLHDLTLDFGIVTKPDLSRPLQLKHLREWRLNLWVPKNLAATEPDALKAFTDKTLPIALAASELAPLNIPDFLDYAPRLACADFLEAKAALENGHLAALLPDFILPQVAEAQTLLQVSVPRLQTSVFHYYFAWNPRLLRLNPHAIRQRDFLLQALAPPQKR